jgi:hypothetical protein
MQLTRHTSQEECQQSGKLLPLSILTRTPMNSTAPADGRRVRFFFLKKSFKQKKIGAGGRRQDETKHGTVRARAALQQQDITADESPASWQPIPHRLSRTAAPRHGLPAQPQPVAPARRRKPTQRPRLDPPVKT